MSEVLSRLVVRLAALPTVLAVVEDGTVASDLHIEGVQDGVPVGNPASGAKGFDAFQHRVQKGLGHDRLKNRSALFGKSTFGLWPDTVELTVNGQDGVLAPGGLGSGCWGG
ncbi:hypothetical protein ABZ815_01330 [Nonomuraea sp. NPDC047529]|uniref:hypothetical protein n=1 Tax=Nonomuraea sp. NPDC047529 TaxID=3155623 RepID=UPI0033E35FB1